MAANNYAKDVRAWFEAAGPRIEKRAEEIEAIFPHARAFVRPGFDAGNVPTA